MLLTPCMEDMQCSGAECDMMCRVAMYRCRTMKLIDRCCCLAVSASSVVHLTHELVSIAQLSHI